MWSCFFCLQLCAVCGTKNNNTCSISSISAKKKRTESNKEEHDKESYNSKKKTIARDSFSERDIQIQCRTPNTRHGNCALWSGKILPASIERMNSAGSLAQIFVIPINLGWLFFFVCSSRNCSIAVRIMLDLCLNNCPIKNATCCVKMHGRRRSFGLHALDLGYAQSMRNLLHMGLP